MEPKKWEEAKRQAREVIVQKAKLKKCITYSDLVDRIGAIHFLPHDQRLDELLRQLSSAEHRDGKALLTALVVRKDTGMPGNGFFRLARRLLKRRINDEAGFWKVERDKVHAEYAAD